MEMRQTMQPTRRQRQSQAQNTQFDRIADRFEALEQRDAGFAVLFERMDGRMTAAERAIADIANTLRESAKEQREEKREEKRTSVPNAQGWLVIALMLCALLISLLNVMPHVSLHY